MIKFFNLVYDNRVLILRLTKRDIESKYKGTFLGLAWAIFIPILLLAVYTFVFSEVFKAKWGANLEGKWDFALVLFCGLVFFNYFSECISRAPNLVLSNTVYVKKILFPLEILPIISTLSALFNFFLSYLVLILGIVLVKDYPFFNLLISAFTVLLLLIPFSLLVLGITYFLSSLGVYIRDLGQIVGVVVMVLMFLSPIFYPVEALPQIYQEIVQFSPVTIIIDSARTIMFKGGVADLNYPLLIGYLLASVIFLVLGYAWFYKTKKGFADVI